jgi:myo-inositol 2-dehydrogenase/D-chiro-inositol 1-dehydrogenase
LVGLGRIGTLHATNLAWGVPGARLVGVADADAARARAVANDLAVPWATSLDALLRDGEVRAVVVATPVESHGELVEQACSTGRHVFCEKPLALDEETALRAISAASGAGVELQVGFQMRFDPAIATLAERARAGELGEVRLFRATLRDKEPPSYGYLKHSGGLLLDGGVHTVDLARYMVGEIVRVAALGAGRADPRCARAGDLDTALITLQFDSGALGVLEHSRVAGYGFDCRVEVMGTRATARAGADAPGEGLETLLERQRRIAQPVDFLERFPIAYRLELESFVRALALEGPVRVTGSDALAALGVCRTAQRALDSGRVERVEPVPPRPPVGVAP